MILLEWHKVAAKAQALSRSALDLLHHPSSAVKARADAQALLDQLAAMGFSPSAPPSRWKDGVEG